MSEDHKHRARIFLHRGDLVHAHSAWEAAVADDRAANDQREHSDSLGNLGNTCALMHDFETAERCYREVLGIQRIEHIGNVSIGHHIRCATEPSEQAPDKKPCKVRRQRHDKIINQQTCNSQQQ